jgi:hypothetical protein
MATVAELIAPKTKDDILEAILTAAAGKGLQSRGWGAKHPPRVLAELDAETLAFLYQLLVQAASGGFPSDAASTDPAVRNPWLDLVIAGWFQEERRPAFTTTLQIQLTAAPGTGPHTLAPGRIAVFGPSLAEPLYYRSIESASVPRNDGIDPAGLAGVAVRFRAERPGAVYNVQPGSITLLRTPVPGVVVSSPQIGTTGSIVIEAGADPESDLDYLTRGILKWNSLGRGWMADTIAFLVLQNFPAVTRYAIRDPGGLPALVDVYVADAEGPVDDATVQAIYDFLADKKRRPTGNHPPRVFPATTLAVPFTATLLTDGTNPAAEAEALERIADYQRTLPIGPKKIYRSRLDEVLIDVASGTLACELSLTADIEPGFTDAVLFVPMVLTIVDPEAT